jgi:phosphatidylglycerophosphate synthase
VTNRIEASIPEIFSANFITYLGGLAVYLAAILAVWEGGLDYQESQVPRYVFLVAAFATQWFSLMDAADGIRARRLKCGSPLGRIVDEAGDSMNYSLMALILLYIVKMPPGWLTLGIAVINIPMFCMEMSFKFTGSLSINANDDLGPMEVELIISLIFLSAGVFGVEGLNSPLGYSFVPEWV